MGKRIKILIVEDETIVAEDIRRSLESLGYTVSAVVPSGEEALKKAKELKPDLILMDILLRGKINGIEAASKIRTGFDIPLVYLTAFAEPKIVEKVKKTAPYGYILKPFEDRELQSTIETALYRHKIEKKLKESEAWLSTMFKSIGDAVIATDNKGKITFMNPVSESLSGWRQEEAVGKPLKEVFRIINGITHKTLENPFEKVLSGVVVSLTDHLILIARDGKEVPVDVRGAPIKDERGKIIGVVFIFCDITERRRAEDMQMVLYKIANATNTTKDVNELFGTIKQILNKVLNTENIFVALYNKVNDRVFLPYYVDEKDKYASFPAGKTLTAYVIKNDTSLLAKSKDIDNLIASGVIETIGTPSKVWLGVPLHVEGEVIGTVVVQSYKDVSLYTERDKEILEFVSDHIAIAIELKRSEKKVKEHIGELEIYYKASLGREKRIIELKREINHLLVQLDKKRKFGL